MNCSGDFRKGNTPKTLHDNVNMPEDLSVKYRIVSVQTETCLQDSFERIIAGFSQKQLGSLMNVLVQCVSKEDVNSLNKLETNTGKFKQVVLSILSFLVLIFGIQNFRIIVQVKQQDGHLWNLKYFPPLPLPCIILHH